MPKYGAYSLENWNTFLSTECIIRKLDHSSPCGVTPVHIPGAGAKIDKSHLKSLSFRILKICNDLQSGRCIYRRASSLRLPGTQYRSSRAINVISSSSDLLSGKSGWYKGWIQNNTTDLFYLPQTYNEESHHVWSPNPREVPPLYIVHGLSAASLHLASKARKRSPKGIWPSTVVDKILAAKWEVSCGFVLPSSWTQR